MERIEPELLVDFIGERVAIDLHLGKETHARTEEEVEALVERHILRKCSSFFCVINHAELLCPEDLPCVKKHVHGRVLRKEVEVDNRNRSALDSAFGPSAAERCHRLPKTLPSNLELAAHLA